MQSTRRATWWCVSGCDAARSFAGIPSCLVGLEACATAHHWARELIALSHEARLMSPNYVKAYVKRNKHDVADAEAICEALGVRRCALYR